MYRSRNVCGSLIALGALATIGAATGEAQQRCQPPSFASQVATFGAGGTDSPRVPGKVRVRFGGRVPCPDGAEWWFEYGPTVSYGQQTTSLNDSSEDLSEGFSVVRTDVDGLDYLQTYHYRFVVRYPDGEVQAGADAVVRVRPSALRPPQRVTVRSAGTPASGPTKVERISVLDAPRGSKVTVSCLESPACPRPERKLVLGSGPTIFDDRTVPADAYLTVIVAGRGMPTLTTITPRPRALPQVATECGGVPVALGTPCLGIVVQSQGARVRRLSLTDVPRGARVEISCRGDESCPRSDLSLVVSRPADDPYAQLTPPGYTRLRPGAKVRVFITRPLTFGVTRSFTVTGRDVVGGSYRCLSRGAALRVIACPTAAPVTTGRG
jgi:hypothetical protein